MFSHNNPKLRAFSKYHSNGNDFIIIDHRSAVLAIDELSNYAPQLTNRHRGIGADGILFLSKTQEGLNLQVINADGSLALNCGNGLRCAALWYFNNYAHSNHVKISLGALDYSCVLDKEHIFVAMGEAQLKKREDFYCKFINYSAPCFEVDLANKHLVFKINFMPDANMLLELVHEIKQSFKAWEDYNLGFIFEDEQSFYSWVFERGVGFTQSCGSGACAAGAALAFNVSLSTAQKRDFMFKQPGGPIWVSVHVLENKSGTARFMLGQKGEAQAVYNGSLS